MIQFSFAEYYAPLLVLIASFIIIFAGLKKLEFGGSNWTTAILALLLSFILISSDVLVEYTIALLPLITIIAVITFFITLALVFVNFDNSPFKKTLAWIGFAVAILITLSLAFDTFPTLGNLLPGSSDRGLNSGLVELKDRVYTQNFQDFLVFVVSIVIVCFVMVKGIAVKVKK
ncbi:hypothetical protein FJZ17_00180 [Candidatus Pacearchaeota archaeon]|nr:hypothetical protein [Candidatus Pacearchaeota archaeon]